MQILRGKDIGASKEVLSSDVVLQLLCNLLILRLYLLNLILDVVDIAAQSVNSLV